MDWTITFLSPIWLLLLLTLPFVVWMSVGSLSGLGPVRRWIAILLRCSLLMLLIAALADMQFVRKNDTLCTLFVLDQSQSIPPEQAEAALESIAEAINSRASDRDQAGLIVFGKNARIELPPNQYPRDREITSIGALIDPQYSDLAGGIKLALGSFPPDCARRIVVFSDGNQNRSNALAQALAAKQNNAPIDVVPITYRYDSEILVDKIVLPPDLKKGDTANLKIVIRSSQAAKGLLRLNQVTDVDSETILEQRVVLHEGLNVLYRKQTVEEPNLYTYRAEFIPDPDAGDRVKRNNYASAFTYIRGQGRILLIESQSGVHKKLVDTLRSEDVIVVTREPSQLREDLANLRQFDSIILANVPAEELGTKVQEALAANTHDLGAGLIMIGGSESFGAGGYRGTAIEKALPVDMEIKSTKIRSKGALVMIFHACELAEGNYWQKVVGKLAIKTLGSQDECGVLHWSGKTSWLFPLRAVGNRSLMNSRIDRMTPGDMPDFAPSMRMGLTALLKSNAMSKHMIIISDGDPSPPSQSLLNGFKDAKISCSTVAIDAHGFFEKREMRRISTACNGRYYEVKNAATLPKIYIKETRVVSRPLIFEKPEPWTPTLRTVTEPIIGLPAELPAIQGFVLTSPKPLAKVPITSYLPAESEMNPILAHWQYGLGKSVAFTTDSGEKWAVGWPASEMYAKFWSQLVRWSMRPNESENLSVSHQEKDGVVTVVVNAIGKDSEFLNFINLQGKLIRPDVQTTDLTFRQTAPGKYEAQFEAEQSGSYFLTMGYREADGSEGFVSTGLNVSYPPEYRDVESNRDLMENLALVSGGQTWDRAADADFFRHTQLPTLRLQDVWPTLALIALTLLFFDVGVRRIAVEPAAIAAKAHAAWAQLVGRPAPEKASTTMERLRSKKAEMDQEFQRRRFEAAPEMKSAESVTSETQPAASSAPAAKDKPAKPDLAPDKEQPGPASYTDRLMKAKKKVWEDKDEKS